MIAYFLPQFHEIPENNLWWGKGFTEWANTKSAIPLFNDHYQPRVPLNRNYYDLSDPSTLDWQSEMALNFGVNVFCFYHYWFRGKLLLDKPIRIFKDKSSAKVKFCISWANEPWTRAWNGKKRQVLINQDYGGFKDWEAHFNYLKQFFEDDRYLRINNKPVMVIHRPSHMSSYAEMIGAWRDLANQSDFDGIHIVQTLNGFESRLLPGFDAAIDYEPMYTLRSDIPFLRQSIRYGKALINRTLEPFGLSRGASMDIVDYNYIWKRILTRKIEKQSEPIYPGAFVDWDNTSRRRRRGTVISGASPSKFRDNMKKLFVKMELEYKTDTVFINAWNEWAEGDYLEPDQKYGYAYLQALKIALDSYRNLEND